MAWDPQSIGRIVAAVVPLATAALAAGRGSGQMRRRLKHDVDLVEHVPSETEAHTELMTLVVEDIRRLRQSEEGTRDLPTLGFAVASTILIGYGAVWLLERDKWWGWLAGIPVAVLGLVFLYGIFDSGARKHRPSREERKVARREKRDAKQGK